MGCGASVEDDELDKKLEAFASGKNVEPQKETRAKAYNDNEPAPTKCVEVKPAEVNKPAPKAAAKAKDRPEGSAINEKGTEGIHKPFPSKIVLQQQESDVSSSFPKWLDPDPLDATQIELVQKSWEKLGEINNAPEVFFEKFFEGQPDIRRMFPGSLTTGAWTDGNGMQEEGERLFKMLDVAVQGLSDLPTLTSALRDLARRHIRYGFTEQHYPAMATALTATFEVNLKAEFDKEVKDAWMSSWAVMASVIIPAHRAEIQRFQTHEDLKGTEPAKKLRSGKHEKLVVPEECQDYFEEPTRPDKSEIKAVQAKWAIATKGDNKKILAGHIFKKLFTIIPSVRNSYPGALTDQWARDMETQGLAFVDMMDVAVQGLSDFDALAPKLVSLAERHVRYGVTAQYYPAMKNSVLPSLEKVLTCMDDWDEWDEDAWEVVFANFWAIMIPAHMKEVARLRKHETMLDAP